MQLNNTIVSSTIKLSLALRIYLYPINVAHLLLLYNDNYLTYDCQRQELTNRATIDPPIVTSRYIAADYAIDIRYRDAN